VKARGKWRKKTRAWEKEEESEGERAIAREGKSKRDDV